MPEARPDDLLPVEEAARLVGRSKSTVRTWVRAGEIEGHRQDPAHPENSRLLVSASAVRRRAEEVLAGREGSGASAVKSEALTTSLSPVAEAVTLRAEVERLRAGMVEALQGRITALDGRIADLGRALDAERLRGEEWRARALGAEAERDALRQERGLPWWRRLLGAPAALTPPPSENES